MCVGYALTLTRKTPSFFPWPHTSHTEPQMVCKQTLAKIVRITGNVLDLMECTQHVTQLSNTCNGVERLKCDLESRTCTCPLRQYYNHATSINNRPTYNIVIQLMLITRGSSTNTYELEAVLVLLDTL